MTKQKPRTKQKTKTGSALDRLAAALAAEGVHLPRNRLRNIAATVAGCRNDNEYVARSPDLYPSAQRVQTMYDALGVPFHLLRDPRSGRFYAVDDASLDPAQHRSGLLQPCPYGGMIDVEDALLPVPEPQPEPTEEEKSLPLFRFHITRAATETAGVEVRARNVKEAFDRALHRDFWSDPRNATFRVDEGNWPDRPYIPDEDDYDTIMPGDED